MTSKTNAGTGRKLASDLSDDKPVRGKRERKIRGAVNGNQSTRQTIPPGTKESPGDQPPTRLERFIQFMEKLPSITFRIAAALIALLLFLLWIFREGSNIVWGGPLGR